MSNMIRELKLPGHNLSDEQQVQAVIRSLRASWEYMKIHMTHNESIKSFEDIEHHLVLEDEHRDTSKAIDQAFLAESAGASNPKQKIKNKKAWKKKGSDKSNQKDKSQFKKRGKHGAKKIDMAKVDCYSCHKMGHFARNCPEQNKVKSCTKTPHFAYVSSTALMADANTLWTVDSGATYHIARDRGSFLEYCQLPSRSRWLYVGNNASIEVRGIRTCKLELQGGRILLLHDVLYVPDTRRNLVSVVSLLKLNFSVNFHNNFVDIIYGTEYYDSGYLFDGSFVLDTICDFNYISNNHGCFALTTTPILDINIWHARLGHIGLEKMNRLAKEGLLGSLTKIEISIGEHCLAGKTIRKPFEKGTRAEFPLQLIHSDICGPMSVRARHEASYFITFTTKKLLKSDGRKSDGQRRSKNATD
ncbi:hypothetical protein KY284_001505 [Solanum tuberosum]|nr:hypothetical protein KY284_001505 [Solanum tuberosum]